MFPNFKTKKVISIETPIDISLFNFSGVLQLDDNRIAICGGTSHSMRFISKQFHIYNIKENSFIRLPDMHQIRFNFPLIYLNNKLYALGGRQFGTNDYAILKECEYYDFDLKEWVKMPNMNLD